MFLSHAEDVLGEHGIVKPIDPWKKLVQRGGPDPRTPREIIAEYGLEKGSVVMFLGDVHVVREIRGDQVFLEGIKGCVNIYQIRP